MRDLNFEEIKEVNGGKEDHHIIEGIGVLGGTFGTYAAIKSVGGVGLGAAAGASVLLVGGAFYGGWKIGTGIYRLMHSGQGGISEKTLENKER